jgi:hypothetical protein
MTVRQLPSEIAADNRLLTAAESLCVREVAA